MPLEIQDRLHLLKDLKIIATGNPSYGVACAVASKLPHVEWLSRASGWEISSLSTIDRLVDYAATCDIFLNNSKLSYFHQVLLAQKLATRWIKSNKSGLIVNVGSTADQTRGSISTYPGEKLALKQYTHQMYHQWMVGKHGVRMTYLAFGHIATPTNEHFQNPDVKKLTPEECAEYILLAMTQPPHYVIEEMRVEARHV